MTWTLRLYDGDRIEIGWVTAAPYEWEITHPNTDADWDGIHVSLEGYERGKEPVHIDDINAGEFRLHFDGSIRHDGDPQEHLEYVRDEMLKDSEVDLVSLTDE